MVQEEEYSDYEDDEEPEIEDKNEFLFVPDWTDDTIIDQPFNLRRDAPGQYDESVPDSMDLKWDYNTMINQELTGMKGMEFWHFIAKNVPAHYSWGVKVPLDELLSWSKELDEPLFRMPKTQSQLCTTIFKLILRYCGDEDEAATFENKEKAKYSIIRYSVEKSQRVRDEIILQLIKQIRNNKKKYSTENCWGLFASVVSVGAPSEKFIYPLMNWLMNMIDIHQNEGYKDWSRFILCRVYNYHIMQDKRIFIPDPMEINYIINRRRIKVALYMSNGAFLTCWIESYTDVDALKSEALLRLGLKTDHKWRYGILEYVEYPTKFEERFLENHNNVMDVVASWIPLKAKNKSIRKCKLFLTAVLSPPYLKDRDFVTKLQFQAFAMNLYRGKLSMSNEEIATLVGMHFAADFGKTDGWEQELEKKLQYYVPVTLGYQDSPDFWVSIVKPEVMKYKSKARIAIIHEYMKIASEQPTFAGHLFSGKFRNSSMKDPIGMPQNACVMVTIEGILIIEEETRQIILELDYAELTNWGCSKNIFVMSLGEIHALNKFYFEMNQAPQIVWMMNAYANLIVNKDPDEISIETRYKMIPNKRERFASSFNTIGG